MSWFKRKMMNEQDFSNEEIFDENDGSGSEDKQRSNNDGERINGKSEAKTEPVKSARETDLENRLRDETARREAAEAKLVGVQVKFNEENTKREKETGEMRQRLTKTLEDRAKQGQFGFLTTLLPVLDNLTLAIRASEKDSSFEHLLEGVKGTARSFEQALISVGVEPIPAVGVNFNPELHEAVEMKEVDPADDEKITAEYKRGYKFGEKLLRPAQVQVGKARS